MKQTIIISFFSLALLTSAAETLADGMLLSAPAYYIEEYSQRAVIQYDTETATESVTILPGFKGTANEFAWVLPMPGLPEVEAGNSDLFRQIRNFTSPEYHYRDGEWDGCGNDIYSNDYAAEPGITIIESQLVGYYQTMTLSADQAPALIDSLSQWGFLHSENIDQATELINSYVAQDWYFVTIKVDSTSFAESYPHYNYYDHYSGQLEPLQFTFNSDEIIYPMRISSLSAAESTQLDLFIISNHRTIFPGASVRYANMFDEEELNRINGNSYDLVKALLEPGDFLTHLRRDFRPQDMTEDLIIVQAENNDEYRMIIYSGMPWFTLLFLGPPLLWAAYRKLSN